MVTRSLLLSQHLAWSFLKGGKGGLFDNGFSVDSARLI